MSWDVIILRLPLGARSVADIPDDHDAPLGPLAKVVETLQHLFPSMDFTDPAWAILESDEYSIEFSIGSEDPCDTIMLHVRGSESAIDPIRSLCQYAEWHALDTVDGELIDFDGDPARGLRQWIDYRNRVAPDAPLRGVALPIEGKGRVFFDDARPSESAQRKKNWWQFWK